MSDRVELPRFKAALKKHEGSLPSGTYWRYSKGQLPPPLGILLLRDPELAQALADDVRERRGKAAPDDTANTGGGGR